MTNEIGALKVGYNRFYFESEEGDRSYLEGFLLKGISPDSTLDESLKIIDLNIENNDFDVGSHLCIDMEGKSYWAVGNDWIVWDNSLLDIPCLSTKTCSKADDGESRRNPCWICLAFQPSTEG